MGSFSIFLQVAARQLHALLLQNVADHKLRRYVLVQLPESLDPEDKDQQVAAAFCDALKRPRNIAEVTKEHLRRLRTKIGGENPTYVGDLGFRVFKLASSNIRAWEPDREKLAETLEASIEGIRQIGAILHAKAVSASAGRVCD